MIGTQAWTFWPSGLRRWLKTPLRKGIVILRGGLQPHTCTHNPKASLHCYPDSRLLRLPDHFSCYPPAISMWFWLWAPYLRVLHRHDNRAQTLWIYIELRLRPRFEWFAPKLWITCKWATLSPTIQVALQTRLPYTREYTIFLNFVRSP